MLELTSNKLNPLTKQFVININPLNDYFIKMAVPWVGLGGIKKLQSTGFILHPLELFFNIFTQKYFY